MPDPRIYTGGRFALQVEGFKVDYAKRFGGLAMDAAIALDGRASDGTQKKHVANVLWTPAKASVGIGMGKGLYAWIKAALNQGRATAAGEFTSADFNYKAQSVLGFTNAVLTELSVPRLDGASKEAGLFDIGFAAERVIWRKGDGHDIRANVGAKQKAWLCSNFRVEIGSLPCARVAMVEAFTWACAVSSAQTVDVTVPNLVLGISYADYEPWAAAARKWFIDGEHLEAHEMKGKISFLGPNLKDVLGAIDLVNVGFKKFSQPDADAGSEAIQRFQVELYVEKMALTIPDYEP